jgi:hypothetical protein
MMRYPSKFSHEGRAAVEAELIRAGREHEERKQACNPNWSFSVDRSLRTYILKVFLAYAHEAIEVGKRGIWAADEVRSQAMEGLRLIATLVEVNLKHPHFIQPRGRDIRAEVLREFAATLQPEPAPNCCAIWKWWWRL